MLLCPLLLMGHQLVKQTSQESRSNMKLLSKTEARSKKKRENDALIESNIRLRKFHKDITTKLNNVKDSYDPEKLEKLKDFEKFCEDLKTKRTKILEELYGS